MPSRLPEHRTHRNTPCAEPDQRARARATGGQPVSAGEPGHLAEHQPLTDALRKALAEFDSQTNCTRLKQVITSWLEQASSGSYQHLREILIRLEGIPGPAKEPPSAAEKLIAQTTAILARYTNHDPPAPSQQPAPADLQTPPFLPGFDPPPDTTINPKQRPRRKT